MSAQLALDDADVLELFDEDGELRLDEIGEDWVGFVHQDGAFFYIDTPTETRLRCGERAVRLAVESRLEHLTTEQHALACLAYLRDPTGTEQVVVGP